MISPNRESPLKPGFKYHGGRIKLCRTPAANANGVNKKFPRTPLMIGPPGRTTGTLKQLPWVLAQQCNEEGCHSQCTVYLLTSPADSTGMHFPCLVPHVCHQLRQPTQFLFWNPARSWAEMGPDNVFHSGNLDLGHHYLLMHCGKGNWRYASYLPVWWGEEKS